MEGYNWNYKTFLLALMLIIPAIIQISEGRDEGKNGPTGERCTCEYCTNLRRTYEAKQGKTDRRFDFDFYNFNNKSQSYDHDSFDGRDLETIRNCPVFRDLWESTDLANQVVDALKNELDPQGRMTRATFDRVMEQFKGKGADSNKANGGKPADDKDPESKDGKKYDEKRNQKDDKKEKKTKKGSESNKAKGAKSGKDPEPKDKKKDEKPKSKDTKKDEKPKSKDQKKDEKPKSKDQKKDEKPKSKDTKKDEKPKSKDQKKNEKPKSKDPKEDDERNP